MIVAWNVYFARLRDVGAFQGGSAIGDGNPFYEAGGTVEVRELPRDGWRKRIPGVGGSASA